ncbi:hypothetical protein PWG15_23160 (plasmid) [Ensifer adhaerens]|uniref:hypothetical protein n=1 Tax=Ensifer adhaerens TaxID=106592 RepID=UPI0023A9692E|nr:hypothetical protein [Ensifer adhaerens]WDZ80672.1 hypothetical protein PWG15_23160 [Ensifer adhaerens]
MPKRLGVAAFTHRRVDHPQSASVNCHQQETAHGGVACTCDISKLLTTELACDERRADSRQSATAHGRDVQKGASTGEAEAQSQVLAIGRCSGDCNLGSNRNQKRLTEASTEGNEPKWTIG